MCVPERVFVSAVKPWAVRAPLALFGKAREEALHAVAIGEIDAGNAGYVFEAGDAAVAVITAVFGGAAHMEAGTHTDSVRAELRIIEANARQIAEVAVESSASP